jgi:hypothetical protein
MAMVRCRECGQGVSNKAEACPHCGIKRPGRATGEVVISRPKRMSGAALTFSLYLNDRPRGRLENGGSLRFELVPGEYVFRVEGGMLSREKEVTLRTDAVVRLRAYFSAWGIFGGGLLLEADG